MAKNHSVVFNVTMDLTNHNDTVTVMNVGYKADLDAETTGITDFHRPAEPLKAPLD